MIGPSAAGTMSDNRLVLIRNSPAFLSASARSIVPSVEYPARRRTSRIFCQSPARARCKSREALGATISHRLAHAPEERQRPLGDAGQALAPSGVAQVPAEWREYHVVEEGLVDAGGRGFFPVVPRRVEPG